MSIVTQDRGIVLATGRVILVDEDTAEVRAVGVLAYTQPLAGQIVLELAQPVLDTECFIKCKLIGAADGQVTALPDPADPSLVTFFLWDTAGDDDKSGAFWFEISRFVGGAVPVVETP